MKWHKILDDFNGGGCCHGTAAQLHLSTSAIWSGLSWAVGEISEDAFDPQHPLTIRCATTEADKVHLVCELHRVAY